MDLYSTTTTTTLDLTWLTVLKTVYQQIPITKITSVQRGGVIVLTQKYRLRRSFGLVVYELRHTCKQATGLFNLVILGV